LVSPSSITQEKTELLKWVLLLFACTRDKLQTIFGNWQFGRMHRANATSTSSLDPERVSFFAGRA
jgi:hypothetical protein